jgi:hypothetical protein
MFGIWRKIKECYPERLQEVLEFPRIYNYTRRCEVI